jgi:proteasome lid subunit RPN8/RPN11
MLFLSGEHETNIRKAGEASYPDECCGILMGDIDNDGNKMVKRTEAIINAGEEGEKHHRFLITPEDMMRAEKAARAAKMEVIGFYHSHPDCPADASDYDREHALPFYSYAIVSVEKGASKELLSWELSTDRTVFSPEEIKLIANNKEDA